MARKRLRPKFKTEFVTRTFSLRREHLRCHDCTDVPFPNELILALKLFMYVTVYEV